jgi:serine/threonine-protein kinase
MIGRGGMGSVWQAMHIALDQPCAVKFIEGELANVAEAHARFEREAKAAAQLRSPHVVQIIDHGVWQGSPYIAMELLEGEDLGKALGKSGGRLNPPQVNVIIQQVCRALTRAHQAGIVHRDLKPDNVMIVPREDGTDKVKVLDFGIAKMAAPSGGKEQPLTRIGTVMGTVAYMSPEQAVGQGVDARTDLYALGIILYEMLAGKVPFEAPEMAQVLAKQITEAPPPLPACVPADVAALVFRLLEKSPGARPDAAAEVADALRAIQGIPASGPMSVGGVPVSIRTGTGAVSVRGATVPALGSLTSGFASRPDRRSLWFIGGGVAAVATLAALIYGSDGSAGAAAAAASRTPIASSAPSARSSAPGAAGEIAASASAPADPVEAPSSTASTAPSVLAPASTDTTKTTTTSKVTKTKTAGGTLTTRQTSTKRQTTKKSSTTKKKRRTGPGGIYIPPPSEWF